MKTKGDVNQVSSDVERLLLVHGLDGVGQHYLAGLPLAEEKFGRDMFLQMAVLAVFQKPEAEGVHA